MKPVNQEATQSTLKLEQDEKDSPAKKKLRTCKPSALLQLKCPDEFLSRVRERCIEKNDVDFSVLKKISDAIISYQENKIEVFRNIFRDDPDLYEESTHVMSSTLEQDSNKDSSGLSFSVLEFLKRGGKKHSIIVENKWSLYEETMMLKEFYLYESDMILGRLGSVAEKLEKNPRRLEEAFTANDVRMIKQLYYYEDSDEAGEEIVDILQSDGARYMEARDVVLMRLRQKKQQLQVETKLHLDKVWNEKFQDIEEKGNVCRHRKFLEEMKMV